MAIYPQDIDGVTLRVENKQVKLCDVYVGRLSGDLAHLWTWTGTELGNKVRS